jgi:hypothetical protein
MLSSSGLSRTWFRTHIPLLYRAGPGSRMCLSFRLRNADIGSRFAVFLPLTVKIF